MLSKTIDKKDFAGVIREAETYKTKLQAAGFPVQRTKIEIPAPDAAAFEESDADFAPYFEWHGRVNYSLPESLLQCCLRHGAHLSRNAMNGEPRIRFITLREHGSRELFEARVNGLRKDLEKGDWILQKQQSGYCIYDNHQPMDHGWLSQNPASQSSRD
jgi:hypothetical protein